MEVALRVHEADADERHAQVAGFLAVVAGQDAEAARIKRQRLMQRELSGEIRNALAAQLRKFVRPPGVSRGACSVERRNRQLVDADELRILCRRFELRWWNQPQHPN